MVLVFVAYRTFHQAGVTPAHPDITAQDALPCIRDGGTGRVKWAAPCPRALALSSGVAGVLSACLAWVAASSWCLRRPGTPMFQKAAKDWLANEGKVLTSRKTVLHCRQHYFPLMAAPGGIAARQSAQRCSFACMKSRSCRSARCAV